MNTSTSASPARQPAPEEPGPGAGLIAGADSIDDLGLPQHGAMSGLSRAAARLRRGEANSARGAARLVTNSPAYRYYAVFTHSSLPTLAQKAHRAHATVEQLIADLKNGPLAHLPSGHSWADSAWLVCAAIAFHLTRAAGTLASAFHARATTGDSRATHHRPPDR